MKQKLKLQNFTGGTIRLVLMLGLTILIADLAHGKKFGTCHSCYDDGSLKKHCLMNPGKIGKCLMLTVLSNSSTSTQMATTSTTLLHRTTQVHGQDGDMDTTTTWTDERLPTARTEILHSTLETGGTKVAPSSTRPRSEPTTPAATQAPTTESITSSSAETSLVHTSSSAETDLVHTSSSAETDLVHTSSSAETDLVHTSSPNIATKRRTASPTTLTVISHDETSEPSTSHLSLKTAEETVGSSASTDILVPTDSPLPTFPHPSSELAKATTGSTTTTSVSSDSKTIIVDSTSAKGETEETVSEKATEGRTAATPSTELKTSTSALHSTVTPSPTETETTMMSTRTTEKPHGYETSGPDSTESKATTMNEATEISRSLTTDPATVVFTMETKVSSTERTPTTHLQSKAPLSSVSLPAESSAISLPSQSKPQTTETTVERLAPTSSTAETQSSDKIDHTSLTVETDPTVTKPKETTSITTTTATKTTAISVSIKTSGISDPSSSATLVPGSSEATSRVTKVMDEMDDTSTSPRQGKTTATGTTVETSATESGSRTTRTTKETEAQENVSSSAKGTASIVQSSVPEDLSKASSLQSSRGPETITKSKYTSTSAAESSSASRTSSSTRATETGKQQTPQPTSTSAKLASTSSTTEKTSAPTQAEKTTPNSTPKTSTSSESATTKSSSTKPSDTEFSTTMDEITKITKSILSKLSTPQPETSETEKTDPTAEPTPSPMTTVTNYVASTKKPVMILETTADQSLTTRLPSNVTFISIHTTNTPTTENPICQQPCPEHFWDSGDMCFLVVPWQQSVSYIRAISYCQTLSDKTDMAWAADLANATLNKQFEDALLDRGVTSDLVFYNEKGSKQFRANKKVNVTRLSAIRTTFYGFLEMDWVINDQIIDQPVDDVRNDISAFCRTTRFCQRSRCAFSDFVEAQMEKVVGLPMGVEYLQEGDQVVLPCIRNDKAQTVRTRCSSYGSWVPHPTMLTCDPPARPYVEEEVEFDGNPRLQADCRACYQYGTDKCVKQENGLFQCVCKTGWTRFTCWKSPDMCVNITTECGVGKCKSMLGMHVCECPETFFGDQCQYNKTSMTLMGGNDTVTYLSWGTMGQITMTSTNLFLLLLKLAGVFTIVDDPEDPQETYCYIRKVALSLAGMVAILWKNPQMLGVDRVGCRFTWMTINGLYTYAIYMAANEAINFFTVVAGMNRNWWGTFEGKFLWFFSYRYRVYYALCALLALFGLISAVFWTNLVHPWTCLSSFVSEKDELWLLTSLSLLSLSFLGMAFGEAGWLIMMRRPHGLIKVKAYFDHLWPTKLWILNKVTRNQYYAPVMPVILFFQWYYLVRSTDEPCFYFEIMAFASSTVYSVLNVLQTLHCTTGWVRMRFVIFAMCYLPKCLSPEYEEESWRNRDEVLAKYRPSQYAKEQQAKKDAIEAEKEKERDEIRKKNQELLKENPNLPQRLLYHIPEDGPEQFEAVPLNLDATLDCYIPDYMKTVLLRRWTRLYLEYRSRAYTVEDATARVLMEEMRRGLLKKYGPLHEMEIRLYNHWCHLVPDKDKIRVREPHRDRVFIMPEGSEERLFILKFDRLIHRVVTAARKGLFMHVKPRRVPANPDVREFKQILAFMKWQFPNKLESLDFETVDGNEQPHDQSFLRGADIVIEDQFPAWDEKLQDAKDIENAKFDKVYEDDVCFTQYIGTPFEEHASKFFNVQSKFCPDGERLANPRNRPLDVNFQDDLMPGFIGPQPKSRVNLGPYDEFIRKAAYYQSIVDCEWDAVRQGAAMQRRDRHMRTGRGEFEGNFDNNWLGRVKMYLWRMIARND